MIMSGIEATTAWTMRKLFESSLEVSVSRIEENMDKYKCQPYLKKINGLIYVFMVSSAVFFNAAELGVAKEVLIFRICDKIIDMMTLANARCGCTNGRVI
jgi:hypothetical protein